MALSDKVAILYIGCNGNTDADNETQGENANESNKEEIF